MPVIIAVKSVENCRAEDRPNILAPGMCLLTTSGATSM